MDENQKPKNLLELQRKAKTVKLNNLQRYWMLKIVNRDFNMSYSDGLNILRKAKLIKKGKHLELTQRGKIAYEMLVKERQDKRDAAEEETQAPLIDPDNG